MGVAWNWLSLRRITTNGNYIPEIDGLRFVAIVSVVLFHIARMTEINVGKFVAPHSILLAFVMTLLFHGYEGVGLFFVISGFVLGLPFAGYYLLDGKPINLRAYFLRRVTRLEPPYIANLLIRLPFTPSAKHMSLAQVMPHFLASLFYVHVIAYGVVPVVHKPSWSLEVEVQFYLLAPLFAFLLFQCRPWLRHGALSLLLVGAGWAQIHLFQEGSRMEMSIFYYGQFFLAGFLVADLYLAVLPHWRRSWLWDVVCLPLWLLVFYATENTAHVLMPATAVLLYLGAFKGNLLRWFFRLPFVSTIGGMCYSIYLTHSLVLQGCYGILNKMRVLNGFYSSLLVGELLVTPVVLAVGAAFFVLIERPCMDKNWPRKCSAFLKSRARILFPNSTARPA